jgi:hypothetical protein
LIELESSNWSFSIWRPLKGPLHDWPLAVCDAKSVVAEDFNIMDNLMPGDCNTLDQFNPGEGVQFNVVENALLHYNPGQKWYYLSNQQPSELLMFRQVDSLSKRGMIFSCRITDV